MSLTRRTFLTIGPISGLITVSGQVEGHNEVAFAAQPAAVAASSMPAESFPSHAPALAREMVAVSHGNVARVRELLGSRPALAKASWDWGYGDWETALGAAAHVGNREIAQLILEAGAPPTIFSAAALGQLAAVQALIAASPGIQRTKGPHGIPLLDHAKFGGATEVVKYLQSLGDAEPRYTDEGLSDADRAAILGTYAYGASATERMTVSVNARGSLVIERAGTTERNLFHLGSRVFHPPGAEAVRIRFGSGEKAASVTIEDGSLIVAARRLS